jgi:hypothetical protein
MENKIVMKTILNKRMATDRRAKALVNAFILQSVPRRQLEDLSQFFLDKVKRVQKQVRRFLNYNSKRKLVLEWMWTEMITQIAKQKHRGKNDLKPEALKAIPAEVRQAVIYKWLRYCKQVYTSKVMLYRKSVRQIGFPD